MHTTEEFEVSFFTSLKLLKSSNLKVFFNELKAHSPEELVARSLFFLKSSKLTSLKSSKLEVWFFSTSSRLSILKSSKL